MIDVRIWFGWDCKASFICNRVTALDICQNLVFAQYLDMNGQNLTKFCIHIIIDKIYIGIVRRHHFQTDKYMPLNISLPSDSAMAGYSQIL